MTNFSVMRGLMLALAASIALSAGACNSPPSGDSSGRVSPGTTTAAESRSRAIPPASLIEASDKVAQELARDIKRVAEEVGGGYRITIVFGHIENKTQGEVGTQEFEMVRDRIQSRLNQSELFRDNVRFVETRASIEELRQRERGTPRDLLQEGRATGVSQAPPEYMLFLNGSMYGIFRGSTNLYYLKFELTRESDGEKVFSSDYEVKRG